MASLLIEQLKKVAVPVLNSHAMRQCDSLTIANEPIHSRDLMERASRRLFQAISVYLKGKAPLHVIAGPGNNGGDGICIARYALQAGYPVRVSILRAGKNLSADHSFFSDLLTSSAPGIVKEITDSAMLNLGEDEIIIDAIFGTGLKDTPAPLFLQVIQKINQSGNQVISVDIPSGMFSDKPNPEKDFIQASHTFTIETPKPAFFYPENRVTFTVVSAAIRISDTAGSQFYLGPEKRIAEKILRVLPEKDPFGHKGTFGNVLLVGGNKGMHGAIALAAEACYKTGAGLTTVLAPAAARLYLGHLPQVMHIPCRFRSGVLHDLDLGKYTTLAIGPGLGNDEETAAFLKELLMAWQKPVLLDADALNLLAAHPEWQNSVKPGSVFTPHPGECRRIFGTDSNQEILQNIAKEKSWILLAKNKYSHCHLPDGTTFINGSGNARLAQGGSGDKLTGTIAGLWARTGDAAFAAAYGMFISGIS